MFDTKLKRHNTHTIVSFPPQLSHHFAAKVLKGLIKKSFVVKNEAN